MDRYRLIEPLGAGGMSVVWRAFDDVLGRPVAVKLLAPKLLADPRSRQRIQAEARAAALLSHPHIATVHDFGHGPGGAPFVVMELVTGRSLEDRLAAGPLPADAALRLGAQLASALAAVHARGLVHRDVKPANVMLTPDGAKLVDFGISAVAGDTADQLDELLGTPTYLAPERLRGLPTTAATDVYSLGLVLYKALTGRLPWPGGTTTEVLHAHRSVRPAPLPAGFDLPAPVAAAILRCLAKAPENRPTAADMASTLRRTSLAPTEPIRRPRAGRARTVGAGAAVLALAALSGFALWAKNSGPGVPAWVAVGATPQASIGCLVRYTVREEVHGAFAADLSLTNTGQTAIAAWTLAFQLPNGQALDSAGAANWQQDGTTVRLTSPDAIAAGGQREVALTGSYRSPQSLPTGFALNDTACQQVIVAAPAPAPTASAAPAASAKGESAGDSQGSSHHHGSEKSKSHGRKEDQ